MATRNTAVRNGAAKNSNKSKKQDPYFGSKKQIEEKLSKLSQDFRQWHYVLDNKNTANDASFIELQNSLHFQLKELFGDVHQISKVNTIVERDRDRFSHISNEELQQRQAFVFETKTALESIQNQLDSEQTKKKLKDDKERYSTAQQALKRKPGMTGNDLVSQRLAQQRQMDQEQDLVLEDMTTVLTRLNTNASTINTQLHTQTELLEEMDDNMNETEGLMDTAMHKMDLVLNKKTAWKWTILLCEAAAIITLLILIIYA